MEKIMEFMPIFLALGVAVILHEVAHGAVAYLRGDDTAKVMGRLTLNPIKHVDPFGTIILPIALKVLGSPFLFGYAKPVPVQFHRLRSPRFDSILVAVAGPLTNVLIAVVSLIALVKIPREFLDMNIIRDTLVFSFQINILLACFNMLPILPLDGGRVFENLLPKAIGREYAKTEAYGMLLIILLLGFMPKISEVLFGEKLTFFEAILSPMVDVLREWILSFVNFIV